MLCFLDDATSLKVLGEERIVEDEDGDGWVEAGGGDDFGGGAEDGGGPAVGGGGGGGDDDVPEVGEDGTTVTSGGGAAAAPAVEEDDDDDDDDSDVPSLDEFDYDEAAVADDDPASMPAQPADAAAKDENVVKTRTYDISVTYVFLLYFFFPLFFFFLFFFEERARGNAWTCQLRKSNLCLPTCYFLIW